MIKIGIIGLGYRGKYHWEKIHQISDAEVVAVLDPDEQKRKEYLDKGVRVYSEEQLDEFLTEPVDLVVVAAPNQYHLNYGIRVLASGKHLLCEKPAALNINDLQNMIQEADRAQKVFAVHQPRRFDRDFLMVKQIADSGMLGRIHTIESRIMGERGVLFGWRNEVEAGGGILWEWAPHLIDQYLQLFPGESVVKVFGRMESVVSKNVEDYIEIDLTFTNRVTAKIVISTFALLKLPRWYMLGDRGTMLMENMMEDSCTIMKLKDEVETLEDIPGKRMMSASQTIAPLDSVYIEQVSPPKTKDCSMLFWENLVLAVKKQASILVKPKEVLRQFQIIEAVRESFRTGQVVTLERQEKE